MALLHSIALVIVVIGASCMVQVSATITTGEDYVLPLGVASRLSPLSSSAVSHYTTFLKDGTLALHATQFCKASGITCSDTIYKPQLGGNIGWGGGGGGGGSRVPQGGNIGPENSPRKIEGARGANDKEECEMQRVGEDKMCATSLEDLLQFARSRLLQAPSSSLKIVSSDGASTSFPQTPTLEQVALKVPAEKRSVVCHDVMFPFTVYSCHRIPHTKVYEASWMVSSKVVHAIAVCHMNTSDFDAGHPAFAALYMKPGDGEVCHWVNEDNLVLWEA